MNDRSVVYVSLMPGTYRVCSNNLCHYSLFCKFFDKIIDGESRAYATELAVEPSLKVKYFLQM
jgi:hypothetical protein